MYKILAILALFVLTVSAAVAQQMDLDPSFTTMKTTDSEAIDVCVVDFSKVPLPGVDLAIDSFCRDSDTSGVCNGGDDFAPSGFSVAVTSTPTDSEGCGEVTITTSSAATGVYLYTVNGEVAGVVVTSATGLVLVPEFTTLGAGLALAGAGFYMYRKRRRK